MDTSETIALPQSDPELLLLPRIPVAGSGYKWVAGEFRPRGERGRPFRHLYLVPQNNKLGASRRQLPEDLYLRFAALECSPESILAFADRHGELGLVRQHFHKVEGGESGNGEQYGDWVIALEGFKQHFQLWSIVKEADIGALSQFVRSEPRVGPVPFLKMLLFPETARGTEYERFLGQDPIEAARDFVLDTVNRELRPRIQLLSRSACSQCGYPGPVYSSPTITTHVAYHLVPGESASTASSRLSPNRLLSAIWLQFAEAIAGDRALKRCEVCREWMDISGSPRKQARRMHPKCSERIRKRRLRKKNNRNR